MKYIRIIIIIFLLTTVFKINSISQRLDKSWPRIVFNQDTSWFGTPEAKQIAENVLLYQRDIGAWPKNTPMHKPLSEKEKKELITLKKSTKGCTIDNGATSLEMLYLSKVNLRQPDERFKKAFLAGLDYILEAQYDNGGWPQFYPLVEGYYTHITYNDDAMVNILRILEEIKNKTGFFSFEVPEETIARVKTAFDKGIECILNTQYRQNGVLTAWCAQHDENTLLPAKARAYELPSLSGKESAQIVLLLMTLPDPSPRIIEAINSAVAWFEKTKITGIKEIKEFDEKGRVKDKYLVKDQNAKPIWARFMELDNNIPFFCDRDGIKKASYREIGDERRNGYGWYTDEPEEVLKKYPKWKKKYEISEILPKTGQKNKNNDSLYVVVAQDSTGEYTSIQEAINGAKAFSYDRITIFIKNGLYKEKVKVYEWNPSITLIGESKEKTIISYDDYFDKINLGRNSTFHTPTLLIEANDFMASNLTIENTAGEKGQAIALSLVADRIIIENCNLIGNQDVLYTSGQGKRQYIKDCYIEGTTDFIFGQATVLFENCIIHSKRNSYITAASTPKGTEFGYVFKNCKLTANQDVGEVYLGRPWRIYAKTVFIGCEMGKHIRPEGWHNWSKPEAEKTTFYAEYNSSGDGGKADKRVAWSHQLKKSDLKNYTKEKILGEKKWYEEN